MLRRIVFYAAKCELCPFVLWQLAAVRREQIQKLTVFLDFWFLYLYLFLYSYLYFKCLTYCEELQEDLSSLTSVTIKPMLEKFLISLGRNRWYDMNNFPNPIHFLYFSLFQINALREPSTRETSNWFWRQISYRRVHSTGRDGQLKVFYLKSDHSNHLCQYYQAFVKRLTKSES